MMKAKDVTTALLMVMAYVDAAAEVHFDHEFGINITTQRPPSGMIDRMLQTAGLRYHIALRCFFIDALSKDKR